MKIFICLLSFMFVSVLSLKSQIEYSVIDDCIANYQFGKALEYLETQDETEELMLRKVACYKGLDDFSKAIELLLSLDKENLRFKSELALCYQALSNWSASLKCYDDLIYLDSLNVYYKIKRADMLFRLEDYRQSLSEYKIITDNYGVTNVIKRSAQCFENLNLMDSAMLYYRKAIDVDYRDVFSMASLININIKQNNFEEASSLSETYIEKDSTNKQINLLNALSYYGADLYDEAIVRFEKCLTKGDSSLIVNRSLGISFYSLGENEKSLPYLQKAYAQDSTNNRILYCLGVVSNELHDYENSVYYFEKLLDRTIPSNMVLYLYYRGLGKGYEGAKKYENAVFNYQEATKYGQPNQKMHLYYNLGTIFDYDLNNAPLAFDYYKKYKSSLEIYLNELMTKDDKDNHEIKNVESSLNYLTSRIERLEKTLQNKSTHSK